MTDDLDRLATALRRAPAPDDRARAAALAAAMEAFDRNSAQAAKTADVIARHSQDRPQGAGFLTGVRQMFARLTSRPALAATTSIAALCLGVVLIQPELVRGPTPAPVLDAVPPVPVARDRLAEPQTALPGTDDEARTGAPAPLGTAAADRAALADGAVPAEPAPPVSELAEAPPPPPMALASPAPMPSGAAPLMAKRAPDAVAAPRTDTESFANADPNPIRLTAEAPVSTFSVDVDTASWAVVRSTLMSGRLPAPEQVRIEEMVNYFPYAWPAPADEGAPFRASVTILPAPWNSDRQLVTIGLQGRLPALEDRPDLNLVFLVDTSGSMQGDDRLGLLKQSIRLVLPQLRATDRVAIVAYAGSAGEVLAPTPASDSGAILAALDRLEAGGSTAGGAGLELAYRVAEGMAGEGRVGRVLLATDGDFNVGLSDPAGLEGYIARKRDTGVYLSVLGFGRGNLNDTTMQTLAQNGNGLAAYIDTASEARKVLVDQLTGALFTIAEDVKVQVEWNPAQVAEYRLIGYETRALKREDFANDRIDAGEIGAGHAVTAIYEVTAPGSPGLSMEPLRYAPPPVAAGAAEELGFLRLRWKEPGAAVSQLMELPITRGMEAAPDDARFAAAIAGMGQLLTGGTWLGDWGWDQAIALALSARGDDPFGYRAEAVNLMRTAKALAGR